MTSVVEAKEFFHFGLDAEFVQRIAEPPGKASRLPMAMGKNPVFQGISHEQDVGT